VGLDVHVGPLPATTPRDPPAPGDGPGDRRLAATATAGLAVLLRLADRSVRHRLPMRLDF
jgi:hypothetical protein